MGYYLPGGYGLRDETAIVFCNLLLYLNYEDPKSIRRIIACWLPLVF